MTKPIILAPAGGFAAVTAAVRCGADAVYLGAKNFNARRNAENFDDLALPETVKFCHERGTKVFVTVNTLVTDGEMDALIEEADAIAETGADAVILQDPAVMRLFRDRYPALPRHASTQTAVHDLDGALYLQDLGCETIVLARELTLSEMEKIASRLTTAGAEAFVHGAHCMSVSGACYLSAMLGGRSGNRGLCAQPCRLDWRCGKGDHVLSLKDMSLLRHAQEMADAGITTFKIEGRMKRPEYVAAVVTACREALTGEAYDEDTLRAVFSRSGFTDGYLTGKRDKTMFGYRTKDDVQSADKVLKSLAALYEKETPRVGVSMAFSLTETESVLTVSDGENACTVTGDAPEKAINRALDAASAEKNLVKTGGTPFAVADFTADIAPGYMLPASALNALRRGALSELLDARGAARPWLRSDAPAPAAPEKRDRSRIGALWARFAELSQIPAGESFDKILLPVERITPEILRAFGERLIGALPAILWPADEEALEARLAALKEAGLREVYGDNIYAIPLTRRRGLTLHGGAGLNILNTEALRHYEEEGLASITASFELSMRGIKSLGGRIPAGAIVYGRLPLMHFRNCPLRAQLGCAACRTRGELTDRRGVKFPVECGEKKYSTLLNSVLLHIADKDLRGLDHCILWFTRESAAECAAVAADYRAGRKSERERTGGLYYRELL